MSEVDLSVSNDTNTKQLLSDVLSNIKAGLRHEIEQRRQLQNDLFLTNQAVNKHECLLRESTQRQGHSAALSQHQDLRMVLNEIASIKEHVSLIKMDLANNRQRNLSFAQEGTIAKLSDDVKKLKEHQQVDLVKKTYGVNDLHGATNRNTIAFQSIMDYINEIQKELVRFKSRMGLTEEKLNSFPESQYHILRQSLFEDVRQLIAPDQPKFGHVLDLLRSPQKADQDKIAQLSRSQGHIMFELDSKYRRMQGNMDQLQSESSDRILRLESVLRAEIRSRKSSIKDIQSQLGNLNEHVLPRIQDSHNECWSTMSSLAENLSNLKVTLRSESDRLNKSHEDLIKSTASSLEVVTERLRKQFQLQNKSMAALKTEMQNSFDEHGRRNLEGLEGLKKSQVESKADLSKQIEHLNETLSDDIRSNTNQMSVFKSLLDQFSKNMEIEKTGRVESIDKLKTDLKTNSDTLFRDVQNRAEKLEISLDSLSEQSRENQADLRQLITDNEQRSLKNLAEYKLQVESELSSSDERMRHYVDQELHKVNGLLAHLEGTLIEEKKDLHQAVKVISCQISVLEERHTKGSAKLENDLTGSLRKLYQAQDLSTAKLSSLESLIQQHSGEIRAEMRTYNDLVEVKFNNVNQLSAEYLKSQNAVNGRLNNLMESVQQGAQLSATRFDEQIRQILCDRDVSVSESAADRQRLHDLIAHETAACQEFQLQINKSINAANNDFRSQIDEAHANLENLGQFVREMQKNLKNQISSDTEANVSAMSRLSGQLMVLNQAVIKEVDDRQREQQLLCDHVNIIKEQFDADRQHNQQLLTDEAEKRESTLSGLSVALAATKQILGDVGDGCQRQLKDTSNLLLSKIDALSVAVQEDKRRHEDDQKKSKIEILETRNLSDDNCRRLNDLSIDLTKLNEAITNHHLLQCDLEQSINDSRVQTDNRLRLLNDEQESSLKSVQDAMFSQATSLEKSFEEIRLKILEHEQNISSATEEHGKLLLENSKQGSNIRELFEHKLALRSDIEKVQEQLAQSVLDMKEFREQLTSQVSQLSNDSQSNRDDRSQLEGQLNEYKQQRDDVLSRLNEQLRGQVTVGDQLRQDLNRTMSLMDQTESKLNQALLGIAESTQGIDLRSNQAFGELKQSIAVVDQKLTASNASLLTACDLRCQEVVSNTDSAMKFLSSDIAVKLEQAVSKFENELKAGREASKVVLNNVAGLETSFKSTQLRLDESLIESRSKLNAVETQLCNDKENILSQLKSYDNGHKEIQSQVEQLLKRSADAQENAPQISDRIKLLDERIEQTQKVCSALQDGIETVKSSVSRDVQSAQTEISQLSERSRHLGETVDDVKRSLLSRLNVFQEFSGRIEKYVAELSVKAQQTEASVADVKSRSSLQFVNLRDELQMEILSTTNSISELRKLTTAYSADLNHLRLELNNVSMSSVSATKFTQLHERLNSCNDSIEMMRERCDAQFQEEGRNCNSFLEKIRDQERKVEEYRKRDEAAVDMKISNVHEQVEMELLSVASSVNSLEMQIKTLSATAITNDKLDSALQSSKNAIDGSVDAKLRMQSAARKSLEDTIGTTQASLGELKAQIASINGRLEQAPKSS